MPISRRLKQSRRDRYKSWQNRSRSSGKNSRKASWGFYFDKGRLGLSVASRGKQFTFGIPLGNGHRHSSNRRRRRYRNPYCSPGGTGICDATPIVCVPYCQPENGDGNGNGGNGNGADGNGGDGILNGGNENGGNENGGNANGGNENEGDQQGDGDLGQGGNDEQGGGDEGDGAANGQGVDGQSGNDSDAGGRQLFESALQEFKDSRIDASSQLVERARKLMPNDTDLHHFRSLVYFAKGEYQNAAAAAHKALTGGPGWDWSTLKQMYASTATYERQLRELETYRTRNPTSAAARFLLGYHYLMMGTPAHVTAAKAELKKAVELEPNDTMSAAILEMIEQ